MNSASFSDLNSSQDSKYDLLKSFSYCIVRNIPIKLRSFHLRSFFSEFAEKKYFKCFHFKHRSEVVVHQDESKCKRTCCCVVSFCDSQQRELFIQKYNEKYWQHDLQEKCIINKINITKTISKNMNQFLTKKEKKIQQKLQDGDVSIEDLSKLSELRPPTKVLPNGNVGTPTQTILDLIRSCQFPPRLIKKLGINKLLSRDQYSRVPHDYSSSQSSSLPSTNFHQIPEKPNPQSDEDDNRGESWELHEALTDDVTAQDRNKERLFEEDIELKWEKGGSGLVFYTDAQYWAKEEGDFDEQNTDNWDVDMNEMYGGYGDRDARDFMTICEEERIHKDEELHPNLGSFERHTKGIGRRIMTRSGWDDSNPALGSSENAIIHPIDANGQTSRKGLGYIGKNLNLSAGTESFYSRQHRYLEPIPNYLASSSKSKLRQKDRRKLQPIEDGLVITTIYDEPLDIDLPCDVTRSQASTALKRRKDKSDEEQTEVELPPRNINGSKLVHPNRWIQDEDEVEEHSSNWKPIDFVAASVS